MQTVDRRNLAAELAERELQRKKELVSGLGWQLRFLDDKHLWFARREYVWSDTESSVLYDSAPVWETLVDRLRKRNAELEAVAAARKRRMLRGDRSKKASDAGSTSDRHSNRIRGAHDER